LPARRHHWETAMAIGGASISAGPLASLTSIGAPSEHRGRGLTGRAAKGLQHVGATVGTLSGTSGTGIPRGALLSSACASLRPASVAWSKCWCRERGDRRTRRAPVVQRALADADLACLPGCSIGDARAVLAPPMAQRHLVHNT